MLSFLMWDPIIKSVFCFFLIYLVNSCSPSVKVLNTDAESVKKTFNISENLRYKVSDLRKCDPKLISSLVSKNKGKIYFSQPVADYIEEYFNNSIVPDVSKDSMFVSVFVDQFKINESTEERYFKYSIRFSYPVSKDTLITFRISSKFSPKSGSILNLNETINHGLTGCLDSFFMIKSNSLERRLLKTTIVETSDSHIEATLQKEKLGTPQQKLDTLSQPPITGINNFSEKTKLTSFGFTHFVGDKITFGFQMCYNIGYGQTNGNFLLGYGIGFSFYNIENKKNQIEGIHFSANMPFQVKYFISGYETGLFIGANAQLTAGQEKINYGYNEKSQFFIGPTLEFYLGLKILNVLSVGAGIYQILLAGSKILPDDFGVRSNLNIWF